MEERKTTLEKEDDGWDEAVEVFRSMNTLDEIEQAKTEQESESDVMRDNQDPGEEHPVDSMSGDAPQAEASVPERTSFEKAAPKGRRKNDDVPVTGKNRKKGSEEVSTNSSGKPSVRRRVIFYASDETIRTLRLISFAKGDSVSKLIGGLVDEYVRKNRRVVEDFLKESGY